MKKIFWFCLVIWTFHSTHAQMTPYEINGKNYSATYEECIEFYQRLVEDYPSVSMHTMGKTDGGIPLHVLLISKSGQNDPMQWHRKNKMVILVNNGIHSGEPDGIDASMLLTRDLAQMSVTNHPNFPENVGIAIIPVYNIEGCKNRSEFHRVDQEGPIAFGTRGNGQNLDLNRDFIKQDSRNAQSFAEIFQWIDPDIFLDNHVSDGADYQHVMTLATTQHNKLGGSMGAYLKDVFEPGIFHRMKHRNYPTIPYVNVWGWDAAQGWEQFFDSPRYGSGYAALFHTFSFTPETHMLKPYAQRVDATYQLMWSFIDFASAHADTIIQLRKMSIAEAQHQTTFPLSWKVDTTQFSKFDLMGYAYQEKQSKISGLPFHYYNRNEPKTMSIKYLNQYIPVLQAEAPLAYIIPAGWWKTIERLKQNGVLMQTFTTDTIINVEAYRILNYQSSATPYEGHHVNHDIQLEKKIKSLQVRKGDYFIPVQQIRKRFIIEVLEPHAQDSYFSWNDFDPILNQKEGFTGYAFEPIAEAWLNEQPAIKDSLKKACATDAKLASNTQAQLEYIFKRSPWYEEAHNLYPVFRVVDHHMIIPEILKSSTPLYRNKSDE
ncbi:MAG: hypothetical protein JNJ58_01435 [Chitinophagaceae bacterium]|nr:hypothetical protein [Chitinophagaceae bacterium]